MEVVQEQKLKDVIDFINEWKEHGDVQEACEKFKVDPSHASKILKGKAGPKTDFLKYLKDKAQRNYNKLRI
jgi:hypothetical protein